MRNSHGVGSPLDARARGSGPWGWPALLLVLLGVVLGLLTRHGSAIHSPPVVDEEWPLASPTPNVHVALHLDEPLVPDRTSVWTVAFQAAWDQLADSMDLPDGIWLGPPARPEALRALNAGRLPPGIVDPGDLTVIAGPDEEATWSAVDRASDRPRPVYERDPDNPGVVAFARLRASLRYETPFFVAERPLAFGPQRTRVRAWGLRADAEGPVPARMRAQARVHIPDGTPHDEVAKQGVVVLTGKDGKRLVLSMRTPGDTLRATWEDVTATLASSQSREFATVDLLTIPRVAVVAGRTYDELVPADFVGLGWKLVVARQDVSLTVDECGADVDAEAVLVGLISMALVIELDGPFLVALLAPGSEAPYVLAWIGSADALSRWGAPLGRTLTPDEVLPFAGAWTVDERASIEATLAAWKRLLINRDHEVRERNVEGFLAGWRFDLAVVEDGSASVVSHQPGLRARRASVPLRRDGTRVLLALPWGDGGGPRTWVVSRDGDRLLLRIPSQGLTLVLQRR